MIEGLFILEDEQLRDLCDIRIFVDTDDDIRFIRRLIRDVKKRGRTIDSVIEQYTTCLLYTSMSRFLNAVIIR